MASYHNNSLKLALLLSCSLIVLDLFCIPVHALNIGLQVAGSAVSVSKECSRKCESHFCTVPPFLRYGKYCGLLYSGCPGEKPCDGLDACCMMHDHCVVAKHLGNRSNEIPTILLFGRQKKLKEGME
ncbi:hypothetical protein CIPAW_05G202000 [Carya illinoinensis]|uniref:Phospholipase A(2) n=1 Tax=Carya illinoinensis TaxID=32201 RepID=A0A8T1QLU6_CARIL|nr:hypothetical protein CIPAW_05G202000 [Carya illinoinensis]